VFAPKTLSKKMTQFLYMFFNDFVRLFWYKEADFGGGGVEEGRCRQLRECSMCFRG